MFCGECTVAQLKSIIENAELDKLKCLNFDCDHEISMERIEKILVSSKEEALYEKLVRFKKQKELDLDQLVRWCPKENCGNHVRAENADAKKLTCDKCGTEICFLCREQWHEGLTCEEATSGELKAWVDKNKKNVSFCPVCRTFIEKNGGCNHMTCGFCRYEFCWACQGSAGPDDNHFNGNGCGVA